MKGILKVAWFGYKKWLLDAKLILLPIISIFIYEAVCKDMIKHSKMMSGNIQIMENFIALNSSYVYVLLIPIFFVIMMSDFPDMEGAHPWLVYRTGRNNWVFSQMITALLSCMTVILWVIISSIIPIIGRVFGDNRWSDVVTKITLYFSELENNATVKLITNDIYNHMSCYGAALNCIGLSLLMMMVYSMVMMVGKIFDVKTLALGVCIGLIGIGGVFQILKFKGAYLFPAANAGIIGRYTAIVRKAKHPFGQSYLYFAVLLLVLTIVAFIGMRRKKLCMKSY